jgi:hypothetical protein
MNGVVVVLLIAAEHCKGCEGFTAMGTAAGMIRLFLAGKAEG